MDIDIQEIGERIKKARALRNKTLEDVASDIGVARSTIQRYENGHIARPKIPVLQAIANALNVNPEWITGCSDIMLTPRNRWGNKIVDYFEKTDAFEAQLKVLGWSCEHCGCYTWFQYNKCGLRMNEDGDLSETGTGELIGCDQKKCVDCEEREEYYLFSNGTLSFKVSPDDYDAFINDSQSFVKDRLEQLLRKSMKQLFCKNDTENSSLKLNAAHERTDIEVTNDMKKNDDDIMDSDEF